MKQVVISFSPVPAFVAPDTPGPLTSEELGCIWLDWVAELSAGSIRNYELVLLVQQRFELPESTKAWAKVTRFPENNFVSTWPLGPNLVFKQIMWLFIHKQLRGPFFWVEPDCVPVVPDWLDLIADEYQRGGKPFMGAIVESKVENKRKTPRHMTGNAVYPEDAYVLAPRIMEAYHTAWDVQAAEQILPKCHPTTLIQHHWRCPEIRDRHELSRILLPNTALFHSDKYGAIPKILGSSETPAPRPIDMPITEYAASRGVPASEGPQNELSVEAPGPSLDDALRICKEAATDPILRKRIAKFMVLNNIVNHGHCTTYGKPFGGKKGAKYKPPAARGPEPLSDAEFKDRIQKKSLENAAASATD